MQPRSSWLVVPELRCVFLGSFCLTGDAQTASTCPIDEAGAHSRACMLTFPCSVRASETSPQVTADPTSSRLESSSTRHHPDECTLRRWEYRNLNVKFQRPSSSVSAICTSPQVWRWVPHDPDIGRAICIRSRCLAMRTGKAYDTSTAARSDQRQRQLLHRFELPAKAKNASKSLFFRCAQPEAEESLEYSFVESPNS
jgi:hypothetical protein